MSLIADIDLLPEPRTKDGRAYIYRALFSATLGQGWRERYYTADDMAEMLVLIIEGPVSR